MVDDVVTVTSEIITSDNQVILNDNKIEINLNNLEFKKDSNRRVFINRKRLSFNIISMW